MSCRETDGYVYSPLDTLVCWKQKSVYFGGSRSQFGFLRVSEVGKMEEEGMARWWSCGECVCEGG